MQFRDLQKQYQTLKPEIDQAISQVLTAGTFISGQQVTELEAQLAAYTGAKHCITCANGTDALTLALMVLQIGPGDAVFVPDFTFFASGETPAYEGAVPIFVDVEEETFNMSPNSLEQAIRKVKKEGKLIPKVIIAVDLFGQPANYPEIRKIADQYGLLILEDGAQGFGGRIGEQKACSFGDISTTSFFPAKPLGCYGDGGAIFTDHEDWASLLRSYRVHGKGTDKYDNVRIGVNSRLDTLQAAVLQVKLKAFQEYELEAVNRVAERYAHKLKDLVRIPRVPQNFYSSWAQYSILLENEEKRNGLQAHLKEQGIPSMIYYPKPMSQQTAFQDMDCVKVDLSVTKNLCRRVLALPLHPYMEEAEQDRVIAEIQRFLKG
ncbi:MAG: DegT/DnrJ/EryC1/StrS family aminotransferase [Lachnospiraceae bacterium]|jgi:UDP-2-acetamido-2-deoxy-ribo-hexuluronate aminotransferase|nr:DegT/DnrJ/EryC1/StrS family aminotransferase [Lachnospiraceae bacterium]MCI8995615.1 DegT/DnrJ/EryC1/StrS family aminotransferase [Lachnospiraceae bacterium]MCI9132988.1 DegT/DnrJ/EryC1/StrS family aminotransferase [Lachnospiraceae bacterium]